MDISLYDLPYDRQLQELWSLRGFPFERHILFFWLVFQVLRNKNVRCNLYAFSNF
jgi:hypothetical protein